MDYGENKTIALQVKHSKHNELFFTCLHWWIFHYIFMTSIAVMYFPLVTQLELARVVQYLFIFYICVPKVASECEFSLTYPFLITVLEHWEYL